MAGSRGFGGSLEFNVPYPAFAEINQNSPYCVLLRTLGACVINEVDLDGNAGADTVDLFKVTGMIRILELFGILTDNTTFTNCTLIHFDVNDGVNTHQLTAAAGPNMNGFALGSKVECADVIANAAVVVNADQCRTQDGGVGLVIAPKTTMAPDGTDTYIRFNYTTTDAPMDATMWFYCRYKPLSTDGFLESA